MMARGGSYRDRCSARAVFGCRGAKAACTERLTVTGRIGGDKPEKVGDVIGQQLRKTIPERGPERCRAHPPQRDRVALGRR